ncbi:3732_t:CDS:1, partial [Scutellospora calospora]
TTDWKDAPKICYYCEKEGYLKKNCEELRASIELRKLLREQKTQKNTYTPNSNTEVKFSAENPYIAEPAEES